MTKEEAIEALKEHKRQIDKKYINTRNSKAIETVLKELKNKDLYINMATEIIKNSISKEKIKDKIEKEKLPLVIIGGRKNKKTLEYGIKLGRRQALRELIEERED